MTDHFANNAGRKGAGMNAEQRDGLRAFADLYAKYKGTVDESGEFDTLVEYIDSLIAAAVAAETERCVKVCEDHGGYPAGECGVFIRARAAVAKEG
jgi:hypothetical protein